MHYLSQLHCDHRTPAKCYSVKTQDGRAAHGPYYEIVGVEYKKNGDAAKEEGPSKAQHAACDSPVERKADPLRFDYIQKGCGDDGAGHVGDDDAPVAKAFYSKAYRDGGNDKGRASPGV